MTNDAPFASRMHLRDGNNTLAYDALCASRMQLRDAENRVVSASNGSSSGTYTFDGNSLRVKKISSSTTTVYIFSGSKVVAEYDNGAAPSSPSREYIYSGGVLLAKIASGTSTYYQQDHLSNRLVTDSSGTVAEQLGTYPFGESWYNTTSEKWLFTTYERDPESQNDYAMMRSYVNRVGRFSSPDPLSGNIGDPQSLNRYSYVENNPINFYDPLGLTTCDANGGNCTDSVTVTADPGNAPSDPYGSFSETNLNATAQIVGSHRSGGFFSGIKDKFLDFLASHANYLPGVCTAGVFGFGTGGVGNDKAGAEGGLLYDKQIGKPGTVQGLGEVSYGPVGVGGTRSEVLVFVQPAPKVPAGVVFAANPQNGFINNSGISIGLFAGGFGHKNGVAGGAGGGAYLTFSSAANCVKNF